MNKDLSRLSMAEELWLWRIRQPSMPRPGSTFRRNDMTRGEAAKFLGMSLERYKSLEAGKRINMAIEELPSLAFLRMPRPEMSLREQLILARQRSGLFIRQLALEYGMSHTRLLTHEDMGARRLIDFWSAKGFHGWNMPEEAIVRPVEQPATARPVLLPTAPPGATRVGQISRGRLLDEPEPAVRPRPMLIRRGAVVPPPPPPPTRPVLLRRSA
jgi:hypothetical protein